MERSLLTLATGLKNIKLFFPMPPHDFEWGYTDSGVITPQRYAEISL